MLSFSPVLNELVEALSLLPGVGPRSAQRMAFYLLQRNRDGGKVLAGALNKAVDSIGYCSSCRTLTELELCSVCDDPNRDDSLLCVVENPADMVALEYSGYRGHYFVLHGRLSPIDGIGAKEIGVPHLQERLGDKVKEIIIATSATVEGEATASYLHKHLHRPSLHISRIAHGVPIGGELDYIDYGTLSHALSERRSIESEN